MKLVAIVATEKQWCKFKLDKIESMVKLGHPRRYSYESLIDEEQDIEFRWVSDIKQIAGLELFDFIILNKEISYKFKQELKYRLRFGELRK